jgi:hypothetical protein
MASTKGQRKPRRRGVDLDGYPLAPELQEAITAGRVKREWLQVPLPGVNEECPACHGTLDTSDLRVWWCMACRRDWELVGTLWYPYTYPDPPEGDLPF